MATDENKTNGNLLAKQLFEAIRDVGTALAPGARDLPVLRGVLPNGRFAGLQENILSQAADILVESGRVFRHGNSIMLEAPKLDGGGGLSPLRTGGTVDSGAASLLSNIVVCDHQGDQFPIPNWFAKLALCCEPAIDRLPRIQHYATRPVFDRDFRLQGPGWHADAGILVHGPRIEPVMIAPGDVSKPAVDRLPTHLGNLLRGFCFRDDADVANAVGLLVTGTLANHFVTCGKPIALVDGNQPGLGKTLLARAAGVVLDGDEPQITRLTSDEEELQKHLCATLRSSTQSILLFDNAKVRSQSAINSPTIEANSMAPEIALRILGKSETFTRPNDLVWAITMNDTRTSPDLVSRGLAIRLFYEGRPEDRKFDGPDPIAYARNHRLEILGELAGMIVRWNQHGRPPGRRSHRLTYWAATVGGIVELAGLPEFLGNAQAAAASFNSELDELGALAEAAVTAGGPYCDVTDGATAAGDTDGLTPTDWEPYFRRANIRVAELDPSKSSRSRAICIGKFLSGKVGCEVLIQNKGWDGKAVLKVAQRRANEKRYFFEVAWDSRADDNGAPAAPTMTSSGAPAAPTTMASDATRRPIVTNSCKPAQKHHQTAAASCRPPAVAGGNEELW